MGGWTVRLFGALSIVVALVTYCYAEENYCFALRHETCTECLQGGKGCAYCADQEYKGPRCDLSENIKAYGCTTAAIYTATSSETIERNDEINVNTKQGQVSPQQVSMTFLPGEEKIMDMKVFAPTKGPLDLYILMDFSNSMADDLDNLKRMGNSLADLVKKLSDDHTIGFGKFVDKVVEPQTDMRPAKLAQPWPNSDPPFSFQNVIKLTSDVKSFINKLQKERISGNLDAPEGGFDAILQAAVCGEKIGWRKYATHLLVFSTESAFHYEADGANVLSGILSRNDELCHLDADGKYTEATKQDYPSIPTLVRQLGKNNIIPIFAVTNYSHSYYEKLQEYFPIAEVGILQEDSSNILHLMETAFESIRSKMSLRAENRPKAFETQFLTSTSQPSLYGAFNINPGSIDEFKLRVKAQRVINQKSVCKMDQADTDGDMTIKPSTFDTGVTFKASVLCPTCECEKTKIPNAEICNGNGDLVCGRCQCHSGWLGAFCDCSASSSSQSTNQCMEPGMTEPCSGRGDCLACGTCVCYNPEKFEGEYCQYDRTQCKRHTGFLCNDRGSCVMGQCACAEGWEGDACQCPKSTETCMDSKGTICGNRGKCVCGRCECEGASDEMTSTCEPNFQFQFGACESTRLCAQCKAWKTGEKKDQKECDKCSFKVIMVDKLTEKPNQIDNCSFHDEDDDCTFYYTVNTNYNDVTVKDLVIEMLEKKECPPGGLLWLLPLLLFLLLLLLLLLLCCWKFCACFKTCWTMCLGLLPCCGRGRTVGFKEDEYILRQSQLTSDHLDTPLVRTGPAKVTDVVRWRVTDNVHRPPDHPKVVMKPNPKEMIQFPVSLRLNRLFSESLSHPDSRESEQLRKEVADNLNEVYKQIPGAQDVQQTSFRLQGNAGKRQDHTIVDSVLTAPRSSYQDIVQLTEKNAQSGNFHNLKVIPGYYTVASDREADGAVEFQEGVESVDVHVPLFIKEEDDDKKQLIVEAKDVPLGDAKIGQRTVDVTVLKEHAANIFSFLQPAYTCSRQDGAVNIPVNREIIEDGRTQVSYRTRDLTAKDQKDYIFSKGDLVYNPGETLKTVSVPLLELGEKDALLAEQQVKQFVLDLSNPRQSGRLGRYPRTTVTIADKPEPSVIMFKKAAQNFTSSDPNYIVPVVRSRNQDSTATVNWRVAKPPGFEMFAPLKFGPGETEKNIEISPMDFPTRPENFQLELFDPSSNASIGERKNTIVNIANAGPRSPEFAQLQQSFVNQKATSPGGHMFPPENLTAKATGPRNIRLNWTPPPGNPTGYKVKYWIYGDPEKDAEVLDVKTPHAELTGLYPYCDYEMRVCGYNAFGDGYDTDVVSCQTLEDIPGEPGRLAFNVISPTVTQISWAEPAETNGNITAYEVIYTPIDEDLKPAGGPKKVMIDNPKKRMLLIENLQSAQTYQYQVRAKNSVGWGPFREASINLASQPTRPLSIPIIPDVPIVDAEAGEEYDSYLMYSNDVPSSKTPSVAGDGWKYVQMVGSDLDLRQVSWKKQVEIIRYRLSTDTEASTDESPRPSISQTPHPDFMMNGKWEHNHLYPGGSMPRNLSTSSSPMSTWGSSRGAGGSFTTESTNTYISGSGSSRRQDVIGGVHTSEIIMRNRSELNRNYTDENIRDSIVMGDISSQFSDSSGFSYTGMQSSTQSQFSYGLSQTSRAGTHPSDINEALYSLDRVLQDARYSPGVPGTPSRLVFSALGPTALKVNWQEPHCEKKIQGYCVIYQQLNGGETKSINVTDPTENSVIIHDLLPNYSYLFKVKAKSQEGWGPEREGVITIESAVDPKSPHSPVPGSPFTLSTPSAPGPLVFTALSPDSLQLSWDKPRKPNGDILGYVVTCEQLHSGGDVRSFQVNGDSAETSLTVPNLTENVPYKFKVQARTTEGFGPEREGIITIESQDGGALSQSMMRRDVFHMPTQVSTRTNVSHPMLDESFFSDGRMTTTQLTETSSMLTQQVTRGMVQRTMMGSSNVTRKMF